MSDENQRKRLHATVSGTVQGVGFRMFVVDVAQRLSITGWVRNRWDDTVEVTAEGEQPGLEAFVEALRQGPRMAVVEKVDVEWLPTTGEFKQFWITQTY